MTRPGTTGRTGKRLLAVLVYALLAVVLPLAGASLRGHSLAPYLTLSRQVPSPAPASFEWWAFFIYALAIGAVVAPFLRRLVSVPPNRAARTAPAYRFPWWGWTGFALTIIAWVVAWSRFPALHALQAYTFTPLWLGYILAVNGLVYRRTGHCPLLDRPACFVALFPASALFWWYFEYLNRYVGNWYYVGAELFTPFQYFMHATISFSTVLPAVASTRDWLASFPRLQAACTGFRPVPHAGARPLPWLLLALGSAGFFAVGAWPQYCYPMVWVAPLLVLIALPALMRELNVLAAARHGDWRGVVLPALAGLMAGFFWEMWNWRSLVHWEYSIPLVDGFPLFEMPILGYAGYLPFGIVCIVISELVCGRRERA